MEVLLEHLILSFVGFTSIVVLGVLFILKKTSLKGTISKKNDGAILDHYNVLMNINEDQKTTLNSQRMKITMYQKKIKELEGYEDEEPKEPEISIENLAPIAVKLGITQPQLALILQSDEAKKFIKKNANLINNVLPLLASTSKGGSNAPPQSPVYEGGA